MNQPKEHRTPDTVEEEITETRADLDHTLDEIGKRLSPHEITGRAVDYAKERASEAGHIVQKNQVPLALVGAAVGLALFLRHRADLRESRQRAEEIQAIWERVLAALTRAEESLPRKGWSEAVQQVSALTADARDSGARLVDSAAAYAQQAIERGPDYVHEAAERVGGLLAGASRPQLVSLGLAVAVGALLVALPQRART